jgi:hypothetical protein
MRNLLVTTGALLLLVTAMSGQAAESAIRARLKSDLDRTRGNTIQTNDQTLKAGRNPDMVHVFKQTEEMNRLVESINTDVVNLQKGVISADLHTKLKRLEKLAKELRQAVE